MYTYVPPRNNKAKNIKIDDVDNNFQSEDVEGALKELAENGGTGSNIDDNSIATNKTWSGDKLNTQFNTVAKKTSVEDGKLYLIKEDGTKIDAGTTLPSGGGVGATSISVNGTTYTQENGTITLPNYPSLDVIFSSYELYDAPLPTENYETATDNKTLNITDSQFLATFYDSYVGTSTYGTVTKTSLGKDTSGLYDIYEYDFCPVNYKKTILLSSGMHTYELSASFGLAYLIKNIMSENTTHEGLNYIKENIRIKIVPIINPWGWNQTPKKYGNVNGVNINRNFDYNNNWASFPVYTPEQNEWNVKGSAPFSEAETQIVRDWALANNTASFWIDCHTNYNNALYDNYVYYMSDCSLKDKTLSALDKLSQYIVDTYGKSSATNNVVVDSEGSIRQSYSNNVAGVPTITLEQSAQNTLWGTSRNNEAGDIKNFEICLSTYIQEFLLEEGNSSTIDTSKFATKVDVNTINANIPFSLKSMSKTDYDALATKVSTTIYFVQGYGVYLGTTCIISTDNQPGSGGTTDPGTGETPGNILIQLGTISASDGATVTASTTRAYTDYIPEIFTANNMSLTVPTGYALGIRFYNSSKNPIIPCSLSTTTSSSWYITPSTSSSISGWMTADCTLTQNNTLGTVAYVKLVLRRIDDGNITISDLNNVGITLNENTYTLVTA